MVSNAMHYSVKYIARLQLAMGEIVFAMAIVYTPIQPITRTDARLHLLNGFCVCAHRILN